MTEKNTLLTVENLCVQRGGANVLNVEHFSLKAEEKLAIIGPNGAGKSSFMLALAALIPRKAGRIIFKGEEIKKGDEINFRRSIALVFQEPLLFDTTVLNNAAEGLRICKIPRKEAIKRAEDSLRLFGITHLSGRSAHKLSGGEAQRVSLARAFAMQPELILMDEPFSSLDLPTRINLADDLGRILHQSGTAAIIATHDRIEAFRVVERLVVIDNGIIIQQGTPKEVITNPSNDFVAAFRRTGYSHNIV